MDDGQQFYQQNLTRKLCKKRYCVQKLTILEQFRHKVYY